MRAQHLYVHVPFCARRCVYCDFSIAVRPEVPEEEYVGAIRRELDLRHADSELPLQTLYFGGGTPSKLSPDALRGLLDAIRSRASLAPDAEVTLEANPEDVSEASARAWRHSGINRVSLGVQSFDPAVLQWMHRTHDARQALLAIDALRSAGIENISIDLIFALPASLGRGWHEDLDRALALGVPHVSVYGLTVESHTPLGRWVARKTVVEAPEESFEEEFLAGSEALVRAGFRHYEVSNYALPGRESRHNSAYWKRVAYGGIGPSAHEFDGMERRWNVAPYAEWVRRVSSGKDPVESHERLGGDQELAETVYLGLRTSEGLMLSAEEQAHVRPWIDAGWATVTGEGRARLTAAGWLRLDTLAADLTHVRSRYYV